MRYRGAARKVDQLKDGDFFGETGLLKAMPRTADVVSDEYSHLLVLYKKDFQRLLRDQPKVKAEIEAVAGRRALERGVRRT